ncbi:MAG: efflux RND transporter permease subunit [Alphaproteobacteria bacterium]|nr:efflux RND transporter permease subunit [Alphaproteobacteria bacterium]
MAIRRPVAVLVGVILTILFGLLSLRGLPIQLTPDITVPTLSVQTTWPGAAPAEVEGELLVEQEEVLKGLDGLERMTSEASQNRGSITLEFAVGTDLDDALVRASNRLSQVPDIPDGARQPVLSTSSDNGPPLAVILLQSRDGGDVGPYRTWAEDAVISRLERVPGVAKVDFFGGRDTELEVRFDPGALAARGIPVGELSGRVAAELRDVSGGDLDLGKRQYLVRTPVAPDVPADLEQLVLRVEEDGRIVRLQDVATVREGLRKYEARVMGNGAESMALLLRREAGSNVLQVTEEVREVVASLNEERLAPRGLVLNIVSDQVDYIEGALELVRQNLLLGGLLAVGVLLVFLRSVPASAVVATAIPVCVMGTALGMSLLGRTVNVVSLAGMAFAVGMVVDNAIVVLENIDTWRHRLAAEGHRGPAAAARAALEGTREVWGAIVASTLTTAAVFLPIIQWQDEVGELLRDVAVAISVSVGISLVVSVLVIPSFSARMLAGEQQGADHMAGMAARAAVVRERIAAVALWVSQTTGRGLLVSGAAVAASLAVSAALLPPMEYLPTGNRNLLFGIVVPPPGYSVQEMTDIGMQVQGRIVEHIDQTPEQEAESGWPTVGRTFFVARPGQGFMGATAADDSRVAELQPKLLGLLREVPGVFGIVTQASLFGRGIGSSRAIELEISGGEITTLVGVGSDLLARVRTALPDAQVRPLPSLDIGSPELQVVPRPREAAAQGLTAAAVGAAVDAIVDGRIIGEYGVDGQPRVDVVLRAEGGGPRTPAELAAAPIATPMGRTVPLAAVAELRETVAPSTIRRIERRRAITLQITPPDDLPLEAALDRIRSDVMAPARSTLPGEIELTISGTAGDLERAQGNMAGVLAMAVVISFLLMAALFEDFLAPLVILVTVPLAAAGGIAGLRLVDALLGPQPLDMMTALGFVILIGVVVNNAILVVDGAVARLRSGMPLAEATADAVRRRVRPIFMSSLTSLAGLLPLVLFPGKGAELYRGVGAVVLGGLSLATVLTLFVVPALFSVVWRLRRSLFGRVAAAEAP